MYAGSIQRDPCAGSGLRGARFYDIEPSKSNITNDQYPCASPSIRVVFIPRGRVLAIRTGRVEILLPVESLPVEINISPTMQKVELSQPKSANEPNAISIPPLCSITNTNFSETLSAHRWCMSLMHVGALRACGMYFTVRAAMHAADPFFLRAQVSGEKSASGPRYSQRRFFIMRATPARAAKRMQRGGGSYIQK